MATITHEDVAALAREARIDLDAEAVAGARDYLATITDFLATSEALDVSQVPPYAVADAVAALEDPRGSLPGAVDRGAPEVAAVSSAPLHAWTAWETATAVRRGEVSALAVTRAALARIAGVDPTVRAWLRVDEPGALAAARAVDAARARGEPLGPLAGVPVGLKDNFITAGLETTAGSRMLQGWIPAKDGLHATRLRAAGAVLLGKLALDEFGMGSSNENTPFAPVRNPWALEFVPGGSSGGSAAAVAARTIGFSLGSDAGGSIRQPASLCGLVGLKPTYGRVSRRGLVAFVSSLDQAGPIARDVRDAALVLGSLAGHDPLDCNTIRAPVPDYLAAVAHGRAHGLAGVRIGIHHEALALPGLDPAVRACFEACVVQLIAAGAEPVGIGLPHFRHAVPTYYALASAQAATNLASFDGARQGPPPDGADFIAASTAARTRGFGEEVKRRLLLGTYVQRPDVGHHARAVRVQTLIARDYATAFTQCDVLASPTTRLPGFRLGERLHDPLAMYLSDLFVIGANLAGLPAMSVPAGFAPATGARPRLPVGLHLIGPPLAEATLLRVAAAHEARTSWHLAAPQLAAAR